MAVTLFGTHPQQSELSDARIGVDHHTIVEPQFRTQTFTQCSAAGVREFQMTEPRVGLEELVILARTHEEYLRRGIASLGGIEQDAGDGDVRAERDAGKDVNALGFCGKTWRRLRSQPRREIR